ncbi:MAG: hypothetical protein LBE24_00540 [Methylobacillus sp.]|jgi:hypothetical protein|nr:hypothetical protein [Methylobacillus sp.]
MKSLLVSVAVFVCTAAYATPDGENISLDESIIQGAADAIAIKNTCIKMSPSEEKEISEAFEKWLNSLSSEARAGFNEATKVENFDAAVKKSELNAEQALRFTMKKCEKLLRLAH